MLEQDKNLRIVAANLVAYVTEDSWQGPAGCRGYTVWDRRKGMVKQFFAEISAKMEMARVARDSVQ